MKTFFVITLLFVSNLSSEIIKVRGDRYYPPFEYYDGKVNGYNADIFRALCQVMGIKYDLSLGNWPEVKSELAGGQTELLLGMFNTEERREFYDFSKPHLTLSYALFIRKGSDIKAINDLKHKSVLVEEGDLGHEFLIKNKTAGSILTRSKVENVLLSLRRGDAECAFLIRIQGLYLADKLKLNNIIATGSPILQRDYCFAVKKGNRKLLSKINEGLSIIKSEGTFDRIYDKWFYKYRGKNIFSKNLKLLLIITFLLIFVILIFILWNWSLKRKVAKKTSELQNREFFIRSLLDAVPAPLFHKDCNGRYQGCNAAFTEFTGLEESVVMGKKTGEIFGQEETGFIDTKDRELCESVNNKKQSFERKITDRSGEKIDCIVVRDSYRDNEGNVKGIVGTFLDISRRKRIEENLIESKKYYTSLVNNIPGVVYRCRNDHDWTMVYMSDEIEKLSGYPASDFIENRKRTYESIVYEEDRDRIRDEIEFNLNKKHSFEIEYRIVNHRGEHIWVQERGCGIWDDNGVLLLLDGVIIDINESRKTQEALIRNQKMSAVGEMAHSVAHDFNNSLQSIIGYIDLCLMESGNRTDMEKYFSVMKKTALDASTRIHLLQKLGVSRKSNNESISMDLNSLIEDVIDQTRPLWKDEQEKRGYKIKINRKFQDLPEISGHEGELRTVVFNLIKNSIEAMPEGGEINLETFLSENLIYCTIRDSGTGMSSESVEKIFNPFFSTKGMGIGRGLGMSGVYNIINEHKGSIYVKESTPGQGTVIEFCLPVLNKTGTSVVKDDSSANFVRPLKILWVDDQKEIRELAVKFMKILKHKCRVVESGEQALDLLASENFELVITDIGMSGMSGYQLASRIKELYGEKIKIIALTGWGRDMKEQNLIRESGIEEVLTKPLELRQLKIFLNKFSSEIRGRS